MSRLFSFQTSADRTYIKDLETDGGAFSKFVTGSLDETFGVVLVDPKNFIHCVRVLDDSTAIPAGFEPYEEPFYGFLSPHNRNPLDSKSWHTGRTACEVESVELLIDVQHQLETGNIVNDKVFAHQIEEYLKKIGVRK